MVRVPGGRSEGVLGKEDELEVFICGEGLARVGNARVFVVRERACLCCRRVERRLLVMTAGP